MKGTHLIRKLILILFISFNAVPLSSKPALDTADVTYINKFSSEVTDAIQSTSNLVISFIDLDDKRPLNTYIQDIQQQMHLLKAITKELKSKKKSATPPLYRKAIEQTLDILSNLSENLMTPIYKCMAGRKTKTQLSPADKADLLAAALKISIDEFQANASHELINQLKILHAQLKTLGLGTVAQTIEYVLDVLVTAQQNHKHTLTEAEKRTIKQAILLKIQLNNN